jgi:hypothetical protein
MEQSKSGNEMRAAAVSARQSPVLNGWLINQASHIYLFSLLVHVL